MAIFKRQQAPQDPMWKYEFNERNQLLQAWPVLSGLGRWNDSFYNNEPTFVRLIPSVDDAMRAHVLPDRPQRASPEDYKFHVVRKSGEVLLGGGPYQMYHDEMLRGIACLAVNGSLDEDTALLRSYGHKGDRIGIFRNSGLELNDYLLRTGLVR